ncbi:MAG: hypothetical protein ABJN40_21890 [Sneathiella sp.]
MPAKKPPFRRLLFIFFAMTAAILAFQYATAQSGGGVINLNSPVSFPVDI